MTLPRPWSDDEIADLSLDWSTFSAKWDRTYEAFLKKRRLMGIENARPTPEVVFKDRKPRPSVQERDDYFDQLIKLNDTAEKRGSEQVEVSLTVESDLPIGIACTGDWHTGKRGTNYRTLRLFNEVIASTPGLYPIGMGDYAHNPKPGMKQGQSLLDMVFPDPVDQNDFVRHEMLKSKGKWLAICRGCHEDWDHQIAGIHTLSEICEELGAANLGHGGVIHLSVGDQTYHIAARHKYPGRDNSQKKLYDEYEEAEHLDIVALGHLHWNDMRKVRRRGGKTIYLRSGSFSTWDEYAQKMAGYRGEVGVPICILFPHEHRVIPFYGDDFLEAVKILTFYRTQGALA